MRRIEDRNGRTWDVVVGRESWGAFFAIFVPAASGRDVPVRQAPLRAATAEAAELELDALSDDELLRLLATATLKDM